MHHVTDICNDIMLAHGTLSSEYTADRSSSTTDSQMTQLQLLPNPVLANRWLTEQSPFHSGVMPKKNPGKAPRQKPCKKGGKKCDQVRVKNTYPKSDATKEMKMDVLIKIWFV